MKRISDDDGELEPLTAPERGTLLAFCLLVILGTGWAAARPRPVALMWSLFREVGI
jgi:hypothetical protein